MSDISLKRSLELLETNKPSRKSVKPTRRSTNPFMRKPSPPKVTLSSIIKAKKKTQQISKPKSSRTKITPAVPNRTKEKPSKAEENLRKLLMCSSSVNLYAETTQKLIKRAQTQKYVISEPKAKVEQATVFTDEDFRKFEREYFCS